MSYTAIITRITTRPHPNADRLKLGTCHGNQVVVGLDTQDGALGLFFPTDGQLSHEYCLHNGLYSASARTRLGLPEGPTGFFDHNRRVRAQRFRQVASDGLWMPLESLLWTGADPSVLKESNTLSEFGGYGICQKYYTPATRQALAGNTRQRREVKTFPKHVDTIQFRFVADQIPEDSVVWLTEKLHGTSGRYGLIWDEVPLTGWRRLLAYIAGNEPVWRGWRYLNGSKNVVLERAAQQRLTWKQRYRYWALWSLGREKEWVSPAPIGRNSWYGSDEFRYNLTRDIELHKGEVLYFEIVGWANEQTPIMPTHDVTTTGLKDIRAEYGDTIEYAYGCPQGTCRMYVYKILHVDQDGHTRELTWHEVAKRCRELGLAHVPVVGGPFIHTDADYTRVVVERFTEGASLLNLQQIREGVVMRAEGPLGITYAKNKSFAFKVLEGIVKETDAYVDPEDVA